MTIAYDTQSTSSGSTSPIEYTHTPVGTPRGALIYVTAPTTTDHISGDVTYGGVTATQVSGSPWTNAATPGIVHAFLLGSSVPTGAQTVSVPLDAAVSHAVTTYTVTASDDVSVLAADFASAMSDVNGVIGPSLGLGGVTGFVTLGYVCDVSGATSVAQPADWTATQEFDFGNEIGGAYRYTTIGTADVACQIDMTAQRDAVVVGIALREGGGTPASRPKNSGRLMLGVG